MREEIAEPFVRFAGLGFLIPCSVAAGYFLGLVLDKLFHTNFLYIVFLILGAAGGLYAMVREASAKS